MSCATYDGKDSMCCGLMLVYMSSPKHKMEIDYAIYICLNACVHM